MDATSPTTLLDGTSIQTIIDQLNQARGVRLGSETGASVLSEISPTRPLVFPTTPSPSMSVFGSLGPPQAPAAINKLPAAGSLWVDHGNKNLVLDSQVDTQTVGNLGSNFGSHLLAQHVGNSKVNQGPALDPPTLQPEQVQNPAVLPSRSNTPTPDDYADLEAFLSKSAKNESSAPSSVPLGKASTQSGANAVPGFGFRSSLPSPESMAWASFFGTPLPTWQPEAATARGVRNGAVATPPDVVQAAPRQEGQLARGAQQKGKATILTHALPRVKGGLPQGSEAGLAAPSSGGFTQGLGVGLAAPTVEVPQNLSWLGEWRHQEAEPSPTDSDYVSFTICGNTFEIPAKFKPGKLVGRSQQGDVW
jgi:hypothetical protein